MLEGYTNANMAGDVDSRKSTSGYLTTFAGEDVWLYQLSRLNILQLLKHAKKCCE